MTGPNGESHGGYWEWISVDPLKSFEVRDGFASPDGEPNDQMPSMRMHFVFEETGKGSRVTTTTYFASLEELEQLVEMGMEEGLQAAMGQMDTVLADLSAFATGDGTVSPDPVRHAGTHQPGDPRADREGVAGTPRRRADATVDARSGRLDDAGLRRGHHRRREVPLRVGACRRYRG
jgi:hypothetical protein